MDEEAALLIPSEQQRSNKITVFEVVLALSFGFSVISIAQLTIGAFYLDKCRVQPMIPAYLVVFGTFGTFLAFSHAVLGYGHHVLLKVRSSMSKTLALIIGFLRFVNVWIYSFLSLWFIVGTVWILKAYNSNFEDRTSPYYCDLTVYLFAYVFNLTALFCIGLFVVSYVTYLIYRACCASFYAK